MNPSPPSTSSLRTESRRPSNDEGSILALVLFLIVFIAGTCGAMYSVSLASHRVARESLERKIAYHTAQGGLVYNFQQFRLDTNYFASATEGAPVTTAPSYSYLTDVQQSGAGDWTFTVVGAYGDSVHRSGAAVGFSRTTVPPGVVIGGTGNGNSRTLDFNNALIGSYNPEDGPFDPLNPAIEGHVEVNGSVRIASGTEIHGDLTATGSIVKQASSVLGEEESSADEVEVQPIDDTIKLLLSSSKSSNDNATLATVFGSGWTPLSGDENYGDLIVSGGDYVLPAGTYRFRRLELLNGATVTVDTTTGPAHFVYLGDQVRRGSRNDLIVRDSSELTVQSGTTQNGLVIVIDENSDLQIRNGSTVGANSDWPNYAGFTQIISMGGDGYGDAMIVEDSTLYGRIYATAHDLEATNSDWYGSAVGRTADFDQSTFAVDVSSIGGSVIDPTSFRVLATWHDHE